MKKYTYNDAINAYEIDPRYLEKGIQVAEEKKSIQFVLKA
ncbi:hypothetical protein SAMN05444146_0487 [Flavobacterium johnsoniae]|nr:hypothetical protein SAMN05444146_0487 [Flavobacterium johnsoniae]